MASIIEGFTYDIFISYRQKDNKGDRWVSEFVDALKDELESTFKEEISVYFDINPLKYNNPDIEKYTLFRVFCFLITAVLFVILSGCEEKELPPSRTELLTSTIWGETNYDITDPELYTCIFKPGGQYYTYFKGYETFSTNWHLKNDVTLIIDNWEVMISELTENTLEYKAPVDFFNLITINKTYHLQSLTGTKVTTIGVSGLSKTSGTLHGFIRSCEPTEFLFEYGTSIAYGSEVAPLNNSSAGPVNKNIEVTLTGLNPATIYHYRFKAVNESGIHYGIAHSFRTFNEMDVADADNNIYNTITIGNQVWMAENLKTTKYNDGTAIPLVRDFMAWSELGTPAYCWYENDSLLNGSNGALYNWHTVNTGKLCPTGWHVPGDLEWDALVNNLGQDAGIMMMEGHFNINMNRDWLEATNESGFSASHFVGRADDGSFFYPGCNLWTSIENNTQDAWYTIIYNNRASKYFRNKKLGLPVRCVKD